jgi:tetratricopeptide (TPR) repeat protein
MLKTLYTYIIIALSATCYAQGNQAARYEIDAKRLGVDPREKDALPRSREFIRLDSTYYVGWMYEGLYKFERSADYLGFKQAAIPLNKALKLFEKDYGFKMQTLFSSITVYNENRKYYSDFYLIINSLQKCYNNIEQPDSSMALIDKIEGYNFQKDFFNTGCDKAWLYHRNRFYTSEKHAFLGNSIEENENLAYEACYKQMTRIQVTKGVNDMWFGYGQAESDLLSVYHYLAILHDYNQQYDSSKYYYDLLINNDRVVWSNYANLQHVMGDFSEAYNNYMRPQFKPKYSLSESDYFVPMLLVYSGRTKDAIKASQQKISEVSSTPGFGWYNIALARSYLYDAQLDSCEFYLDKAANFKELHINTSFTQAHYDFAINLLRVQMLDNKITLEKFVNKGWWYSASSLFTMLGLKVEKMLLEYSTILALASNPERNQVVYSLFASEAIVSYDETMFFLQDFCSPFFEEKYKQLIVVDKREKIKKYLKLSAARFAVANGNDEDAKTTAYEILNESIPNGTNESSLSLVDTSFEKLFSFRLYQTLINVEEDEAAIGDFSKKCFELYPQQLLFANQTIKMNVSFEGLQDDEKIKTIMEDVKDANIELSNDDDVPKATLVFDKKNDTYRVTINVSDASNKKTVNNGELLFKNESNIGSEIAMRLFGKGGAVKPEWAFK